MQIPSHSQDLSAIPLDRQEKMRAKAQELEGAFLAEMLGRAGLQPVQGPFGGGDGENQFTSFLREEQARQMVAAGGIGLSEALFRSMIRAESHEG